MQSPIAARGAPVRILLIGLRAWCTSKEQKTALNAAVASRVLPSRRLQHMLIERPVAAHQTRRRGKCRERVREETMEVLGKHTSGKIKTGAAKFCRAPEIHIHELVAIVIVLIPIAFAMPAVAVFVPPAVPLMPAVFPRFMQFMPRTIRWSAVPAVMLHGFVQSPGPPWRCAAGNRRSFRRTPEMLPRMPACRETPLIRRTSFEETSSLPCRRSCFLHPPTFAPTGWGDVLLYRTRLPGECSKRWSTP